MGVVGVWHAKPAPGEAQGLALPAGRVRAQSETEGKRGRVSLFYPHCDPLQSPIRFTVGASFTSLSLRFGDLRPPGIVEVDNAFPFLNVNPYIPTH